MLSLQREGHGPRHTNSRDGRQQGIELLHHTVQPPPWRGRVVRDGMEVSLVVTWSHWFVCHQFHASVYFDQEQQCYMLQDQGSQNGTVLNGNRILQVSQSVSHNHPFPT